MKQVIISFFIVVIVILGVNYYNDPEQPSSIVTSIYIDNTIDETAIHVSQFIELEAQSGTVEFRWSSINPLEDVLTQRIYFIFGLLESWDNQSMFSTSEYSTIETEGSITLEYNSAEDFYINFLEFSVGYMYSIHYEPISYQINIFIS